MVMKQIYCGCSSATSMTVTARSAPRVRRWKTRTSLSIRASSIRSTHRTTYPARHPTDLFPASLLFFLFPMQTAEITTKIEEMMANAEKLGLWMGPLSTHS